MESPGCVMEMPCAQGTLRGIVRLNGHHVDGEILPMVQRSEFKRRQAPVVLKVSPKAFGPGRHIPVVARTRD